MNAIEHRLAGLKKTLLSNELFSAHYLFHMFESRYLENIRCYSNSNRSMLSFSNRIKYSARQKNEFHSSFTQAARQKLISQLLPLPRSFRETFYKKKKRKKNEWKPEDLFSRWFELLIDDYRNSDTSVLFPAQVMDIRFHIFQIDP